jgi:hypothetical protein
LEPPRHIGLFGRTPYLQVKLCHPSSQLCNLREIHLTEVSDTFGQRRGAIFYRIREALELSCSCRRDQSVLSQVPAQSVDQLGALADEHLPRAKQHGAGLLVFRLHRDQAHGGAQRRLDNGLRIRGVVFLALYERLHMDRRDQAHRVAKLPKFASPAICRGASLHGHNTGGLLGKERQHLAPRKLLAKHNRPVVACAMQLENALCTVNADDGDVRHGYPLFL